MKHGTKPQEFGGSQKANETGKGKMGGDRFWLGLEMDIWGKLRLAKGLQLRTRTHVYFRFC